MFKLIHLHNVQEQNDKISNISLIINLLLFLYFITKNTK